MSETQDDISELESNNIIPEPEEELKRGPRNKYAPPPQKLVSVARLAMVQMKPDSALVPTGFPITHFTEGDYILKLLNYEWIYVRKKGVKGPHSRAVLTHASNAKQVTLNDDPFRD